MKKTTLNERVELTPVLNVPNHPTPKEHWAHRIVWFIMALAALCIGLLIYWSVANSDVLIVKNNPVPVRTIRPHPSADGVVFLTTNYCKNVKAEGVIRTSFVTSTREFFFPVSKEDQDPVCETREFPVAIPHEILPGRYHVHFRITYQVNPIKTVVEEFDSQEFDVVQAQ